VQFGRSERLSGENGNPADIWAGQQTPERPDDIDDITGSSERETSASFGPGGRIRVVQTRDQGRPYLGRVVKRLKIVRVCRQGSS
jgi:hypothetical protein